MRRVQPFITSRAFTLVTWTSTNNRCTIPPAHGLSNALLDVGRSTHNDYRINHDAGDVILAITKPITCNFAGKHAHPSD
ncbi:hypothetical protein KVT40_007468 [Elsinoe batatas]|uniref:Uncharacterized protein n=1 Tax=Elsinoe batatas TaxID=2601811 RepID=A0A8K0KUS6_9PEZI|nr:hypothetical protein KVT40_007468 [Elsinoe batatas]